MRGSDVWIVLVGPIRSGKTKFAHASNSFVSDFLEVATSKPALHDPYYIYMRLYRLANQYGISKLQDELELLPTPYRTYLDTKILREMTKHNIEAPIPLASIREETGIALKTYVIRNLGGYNLFVFDMLGEDFESFFFEFLTKNKGILLSDDKDEIVRHISLGFLEFAESRGIIVRELSERLSKIRRAKDITSFFSWSRKVVWDAYMGKGTFTQNDVTFIVLFNALLGNFTKEVKTALLVIYGPDTMDDRRKLEELRLFLNIASNTRRLIGGSPEYIGISHAKIDLMYKEYVKKSGGDPLDHNLWMSFVNRYLTSTLRGPYVIKSIHASVHDEEFAHMLQDPLDMYSPVYAPYNVLSSIYGLFELCTRGRTSIPSNLYNRTLPYPYVHLYYSLMGGI